MFPRYLILPLLLTLALISSLNKKWGNFEGSAIAPLNPQYNVIQLWEYGGGSDERIRQMLQSAVDYSSMSNEEYYQTHTRNVISQKEEKEEKEDIDSPHHSPIKVSPRTDSQMIVCHNSSPNASTKSKKWSFSKVRFNGAETKGPSHCSLFRSSNKLEINSPAHSHVAVHMSPFQSFKKKYDRELKSIADDQKNLPFRQEAIVGLVISKSHPPDQKK